MFFANRLIYKKMVFMSIHCYVDSNALCLQFLTTESLKTRKISEISENIDLVTLALLLYAVLSKTHMW